jgi:nitrate reductase gamma subunit
MEAWLSFARGPFFKASLVFMVLGLARILFVAAVDLARLVWRAGDRNIRWRQALRAEVKWLVPLGKFGSRPLFGATTFVFHASVLVVLLAGHVALWRRGLGISWPAMPNALADVATLLALAAAAALVLQRSLARDTRSLGRFQDYAIPFMVAIPFASGFLVMHPGWNPVSFEAMLLVHVLSADVLLILIPFTKLSHAVLFPMTQVVSETAWHWPPDAGSRVAAALGKDTEPV